MTVLSATLPDGGGKNELVIDSSKVEKTPQWTPGVGEPPLMIGKATSIALSWGKKHFSRFDGVEIDRISLADSSCSGEGKKWYYIFEFTPVMAGNRMFGSGNWLAVLMDGSIIETQITKQVQP
jgi:hypothetical protein